MRRFTPIVGQADHTYGVIPNHALLRFIGPMTGTLLDVGCGEGAWAPLLRAQGAERLVGVEPSAAAALAAARYDLVLRTTVEDSALTAEGPFDVIVIADCLEHVADPWLALRNLRASATPTTRLIVSVPNLRFVGLLGPLLLRGSFEYSEMGGMLDRGHLRWFTEQSLRSVLASSGWSVLCIAPQLGRRARVVDRLTIGRARGLLSHQLFVLAQPTLQ